MTASSCTGKDNLMTASSETKKKKNKISIAISETKKILKKL